MPEWAINQGNTSIAIQVFHVLFRHLRGCILAGTSHSYRIRKLRDLGRSSSEGRPTPITSRSESRLPQLFYALALDISVAPTPPVLWF